MCNEDGQFKEDASEGEKFTCKIMNAIYELSIKINILNKRITDLENKEWNISF